MSPAAMRARVVELYLPPDERTIAEVAAELSIGRETVREHLIAANVPRRAPKARGSRDPALVAQAVRMYRDERRTLAQVAQTVGRRPTTVRSWLIGENVELRPPGVSADDISLDETVALYQSGLTIDEVAASQALHPSTVWDRLVARGVPRRRPGRRHSMSLGAPRPGAPVAAAPVVPKVMPMPPLPNYEPSSTGGLDALFAMDSVPVDSTFSPPSETPQDEAISSQPPNS
jgi:transposase-like protein